MAEEFTFSSKYILRALHGDFHPFTPNLLTIDENRVEFERRNWHMISVDTETLDFQNITGITVDKKIFGATLNFKSTGSDPIIVNGFGKKDADKIRKLCMANVMANTQRRTSQAMSDALKNSRGPQISIADELQKLKNLVDAGILTQSEFDEQKAKLLRG
jgi:hypothetical protein